MKDKLLFWLDQDFTHFGIGYYLQKKYEFDFYAIIDITDKTKKFFEKQDLIKFQKVWYYFDNVSEKEKNPDLNYLQNIEKRYKINLWELAVNERIFYRFNNFYKFTDDEILAILTQECKLFESILDEVKPDFFITKQPNQHKDNLFYKICRARGIKIIMLSQPKFAYHSTLTKESQKFDTTETLDDLKDQGKTFDELRDIRKSFDNYKQVVGSSNKFAVSKTEKLKAAIQFLFLSNNSNIKTHYTYYGRNKLRVLLHEIISSLKKRYRKNFIDKHFLTKIENNDKFIYFPLAVDEERTLLVDAPFFTNQLEILRNIVKSMPIDYKLYVKETPSQRARKWRKISEYKEMLEIPNVRMIHPSVPPAELYKKCSLVITIIGSAGLEAAFYEKPAIVFSDINYAILPSVSRIKSFEDLSKAIHNSLNKKVMASDLDKYITLVKKNSFLADIFELRTNQHNCFFYGGYLIDVDIPIPKMKNFLEENKSTFEKLADENFKKIKEYKKITNLDISN